MTSCQTNFYFAYGGNTNPNHMARSYPDAVAVGVGYVKGFQLVFRTHNFPELEASYCDIFEVQPNNDDWNIYDPKVYGVVYSMPDNCVKKLDSQELMYTKIKIPVWIQSDQETKVNEAKVPSEPVECFTYQMIDQTLDLCKPTCRYFKVVSTGYKHYNLPMTQLRNAMFVSL